jgi:hypothetical protein
MLLSVIQNRELEKRARLVKARRRRFQAKVHRDFGGIARRM